MGRSFDVETPVLWYGPRAHDHKPGPRNERGWLLWPAWAYRVIAPSFERRKLNALQQAVLGILRASRLSAAELGTRLGIHPELAAFIVYELQSQGRVDDDWGLTSRGVEVLDEQRDASARMVPGWVFQDPWTGELWPFVAPSLEYARTQTNDKGYPMLDLGTTGKPWTQSAWLQFPRGQGQPAAPGPQEIIRAAAASVRLDQRARHLELGGHDELEPVAMGRVTLERVSRIEELPEPVLLATYIYAPDGDEMTDWYVCEPFGRGPSLALRRLIDELSRDDDRLCSVLDRVLDKRIGESSSALRRAAQARKIRAKRVLERTFTVDICTLSVSAPLTEMIEGWLEAHELSDWSVRRRRGVLASCRVALEHLFRELAQNWPLTGVSERLSRNDRESNAAQIRGAAATLGLDEPPPAMCGVKWGHLRSVAEFNDSGSLRAVAVATLLRARDQPDHPLARAAGVAPDLLNRVEFVAKQAGAELHDGDKGGFDPADIDVIVQACAEIVGHVHELPVRQLNEVING